MEVVPRIQRTAMFTSVTCSGTSRPKTWTVSPKGITLSARKAVITGSAGAMRKTTLSAPPGIRSSLKKSLMPSAMVWSSPKGPTRCGPIRSCMWPRTFRSIQTMRGTPRRTKPKTMRTLTSDSIRKARSTRLLQLVQEAIELWGRDVLVVTVVHHEHRRGAAGAQAFHRDVGEAPILRGLAVRDLELLLDLVLKPLSAQQRAGEIPADLDHVTADRLLLEHGVEGDDLAHRLGGEPQDQGHLALRLLAQPGLVGLSDMERRDERRLMGLVDLLERLDLLARLRREHGSALHVRELGGLGREILPERMAQPAVRRQDALQIGMSREPHAEHVVDLPLHEVGT